jgi:predicted PhzF superfamily epimerase YddE/YHI9
LRRPALLVEAFAERACQGNGAAVVWLDRPLADPQLQAIARSLNQSETAFLLRWSGHGGKDPWLLRWFTPTCEMPLCGHATLAALLALGHWGELAPGGQMDLWSRSGPLPVHLDPSRKEAGAIVLPSSGLTALETPAAVVELLQEWLGEGPQRYWDSPLGYRVALLSTQAPLEGLRLPLDRLPAAERLGLVLMQPLEGSQRPVVMGRQADYQLRFFAPGLGIAEDPVTGSAHALVAPFWLEQLGGTEVVGWQCSSRSGGMVCGAASSGMIRLCGAGHVLWNGSLNLPGFDTSPTGHAWSTLAP